MSKNSKLTSGETEISLRAYEIWEVDGKPHGKDFEHWLTAEAELAAIAEKPVTRGAPAKKLLTREA